MWLVMDKPCPESNERELDSFAEAELGVLVDGVVRAWVRVGVGLFPSCDGVWLVHVCEC